MAWVFEIAGGASSVGTCRNKRIGARSGVTISEIPAKCCSAAKRGKAGLSAVLHTKRKIVGRRANLPDDIVRKVEAAALGA